MTRARAVCYLLSGENRRGETRYGFFAASFSRNVSSPCGSASRREISVRRNDANGDSIKRDDSPNDNRAERVLFSVTSKARALRRE